MDYTLPLAQFLKTVQKHPDKIYLHQPVDGQLKTFSWAEADKNARAVAGCLKNMGLTVGDRVGILSKNCAEWFIADLAIMMAGMISVPIYHTANRETIQYVIENSNCKCVFVGKLDGLVEAEAGIAKEIPRIIFPYPTIIGQIQWQALLDNEPLQTLHQPDAEDTMSIVYTSGSTGKPKGVVLSFENLASAAVEAANLNHLSGEDRILSYLPLAHITERGLVENVSFYTGCKIYFVESLETFVDDIKRSQPDLFISVPRLWNKFQSGILAKIPDKKLQFLLKIPLIKHWLAKKIRQELGFNRTRIFGSGTASIPPEILRWFNRIGVPISEGWGMTETSGLSCTNLPFNVDAIGTIGKPIGCVEMKIGENQEIMIRGAAVFKEYYKNPGVTSKSFTDDWFHTGDMGELTEDGDYRIIGRVKEQFKTSKGKYVVPAPIENLLGYYTEIEQVCVVGQGRKQPIALVVMNPQNNLSNPKTTKALLETLEKTNSQLESHQKLDHLVILKENWTVENNLLTPTLKIKRSEIETTFQHYLEQEILDKIFWEK